MLAQLRRWAVVILRPGDLIGFPCGTEHCALTVWPESTEPKDRVAFVGGQSCLFRRDLGESDLFSNLF